MITKKLANWQRERKLKAYQKTLSAICAFEPQMQGQSDSDFSAAGERFKVQLARGEALTDLVPEIFATVREATRRSIGLRPYDTQVLGALALAQGSVVEMGTGEGKTLTAPFAAYLHFLQGKQTHIVTVNEYLAQRDATQLFPLYKLLGMTVSVCRQAQSIVEKRTAYQHDVVYGTQGEFALDYLRDNVARKRSDVVQVRGLSYAIVDEADSVLIDDARTPLMLFSSIESQTDLNQAIDLIAQGLDQGPDRSAAFVSTASRLVLKFAKSAAGTSEVQDDVAPAGDFALDRKLRMAELTDSGYQRITQLLIDRGLLSPDQARYEAAHQLLLQKVGYALTVRHLMHRDQDYVVQDGTLIPIDALTGRLNHGRTWGSELLQALQAKEGLAVAPERRCLASIPIQNFFKLYEGLAGMTGTAQLEAEELMEVYGLDVVVIPPNKPSIRIDGQDKLYRTQAAKLEAVVQDVISHHMHGRPVLIGTCSVEQSQTLSDLLANNGLPHQVLNASAHKEEAQIIAQAGKPYAITVSTNMAGRGVDIILGGNFDLMLSDRLESLSVAIWDSLSAEKQKSIYDRVVEHQRDLAAQVIAAGGLHVIGMERYESRRMDQQLRGRAGRQGDPGSTCFYLSFEDNLIENFAGERIRSIMATLDLKAGDALEHAMIAKAIDSAQRQIEGQNKAVRQALVSFDEVLNTQRRAYYLKRNEILHGEGIINEFKRMRKEYAEHLIAIYAGDADMSEQWNLHGLHQHLLLFGQPLLKDAITGEVDEQGLFLEKDLRGLEEDELARVVQSVLRIAHEKAASQVDRLEARASAERYAVLGVMDGFWFSHLESLEELRRGIHLRGHAKVDPRHAYKSEAFDLFKDMLSCAREAVVIALLTWKLVGATPSIGEIEQRERE